LENAQGTTSSYLQMSGISKAFPGVQALDSASLSVKTGEIHGLVGENGAGKSTIIKVLAGVYSADAGSIIIDAKKQDNHTPYSVHTAGVRFIHQELNLVPHFTVAETVFMGQEVSGKLGVKKREMKRRSEQFLRESLHYELPGNKLIRDLGVAERKLVQIARALIDNKANIIVFDEPTGPLANNEVEQLFQSIRSLRERGIAIVYVSHYLGEITDLCDRVTVFRNGSDVAVLAGSQASNSQTIIQHMVGRDITTMYPQRNPPSSDAILKCHNLNYHSQFANVCFDVKKGEIVGIAGLVGSGREELVDVLYGLRLPTTGNIELDGQPISIDKPHTAVKHGAVLIPRDRRNAGLVLDMNVTDNINLASLDKISALKLERNSLARKRAARLIEKLDIRPANEDAIVRFLSGGNQQKVVLARWLATESKLFILDEPTIGVDIGAKVEIYQLISDLVSGYVKEHTNDQSDTQANKQKGFNKPSAAGAIVSSSDPAELLGICDRVIVLLRGKVVANQAVSELSIDSLLALTTGGQVHSDAASN